MDDEPRFSFCTLVAGTCWLSAFFLLLTAWAAWALDNHAHLAILIAETACILAAIAATAQIRCYSARVCRLIRVTSGQRRPEGELREFGPRR